MPGASSAPGSDCHLVGKWKMEFTPGNANITPRRTSLVDSFVIYSSSWRTDIVAALLPTWITRTSYFDSKKILVYALTINPVHCSGWAQSARCMDKSMCFLSVVVALYSILVGQFSHAE